MSEDFVTFRDLGDKLDGVHEKIDAVDQKVDDNRVETERRFGRLEKLILVVGLAVASPKLGGPDPSTVVGAVFHHLT